MSHQQSPHLRLDFNDQVRLIGHLVRWIVLGAAVGVLAGLSSAAFLQTLTWVTDFARRARLAVVPSSGGRTRGRTRLSPLRRNCRWRKFSDHRRDPRSRPRGYRAEWHPSCSSARSSPTSSVDRPVVKALQFRCRASLTDWFSRLARLDPDDRRLMLIAAIAGGFGAVFGVPIAGCVFALEVQSRRPNAIRRSAARIVCVTRRRPRRARTRGGTRHPTTARGHSPDSRSRRQGCHRRCSRSDWSASPSSNSSTPSSTASRGIVRWPPARPVVGGLGVIGLVYLVGTRDYLGLSLPLISASTAGGAGIVAGAFALKLLFTAVTLGCRVSRWRGDAVVRHRRHSRRDDGPSTRRANSTDGSRRAGRSVRGCSEHPTGLHDHGSRVVRRRRLALFAIACVVSYIFSSHRSIYGTQRIDVPKGPVRHNGLRINRSETAGRPADAPLTSH